MRGLNDCPIEIISAIWELILSPEDIKNFALVSWTIYHAASPFIEQHHVLRGKYFSYTYDPGTPGDLPATLLKDIYVNPHIALYVNELYIQDYVVDFDGHPGVIPKEELDSDSWHLSYPKKTLDLLTQGIQGSKYVSSEEAPRWVGALNEGDETPIISLLLTLLPNLHVLLVKGAEDYILSTVSRIVNDPSSELLSKLTRVELNYTCNVQHQDMHSVALFARLPSIRTIYATRIISTDSEGTAHKDLLIPYKSSGLEVLSFDSCGISMKDLFELLEGIKALKKFEYTTPRVAHKEQEYSSDLYDPFLIRAALLSYATHSLEVLTLAQANENQSYVGNLRMFEALKEICIQYYPQQWPEEENPTQILDRLPTSMEKIELVGIDSGCTAHLDRFIPCLLEAKTLRLTRLRQLYYETYSYEDFTHLIGSHAERVMELCTACEQKGVSLVIGEPPEPSD